MESGNSAAGDPDASALVARLEALESGPFASEIDDLCRDCERAIAGFGRQHKSEVDRYSAVLRGLARLDQAAVRAQTLANCCFFYERIGCAYEGIACGEAARTLARAEGLKNLERKACNSLAGVYMATANFEMACDCLDRTVVLARELGDAFLQCVALTMTVALLKEMGLYADAIRVADTALSYRIDTVQGRHLRFLTAGNGLFCAHRLRDETAGLRYLTVGSEALENPEIDPVSRATFENYRALYLISHQDAETAELLVQAARRRLHHIANPRVEILLGLAEAMCEWASLDPTRMTSAKKTLRELYHRSKQLSLYHDDVLRALMQVFSRGSSANDAEAGLAYAKELVSYTTSVKRAKFYRQLSEGGVAVDGATPFEVLDPLASARRWLDREEPAPGAGNHVLRKHDELNVIHEDLARMRAVAVTRNIRTYAYDMAENWALAAEVFDDTTGQHCFRVGRLSGMLAREIGMDDDFCIRIEHAARLHDIGKIAVNEMILLKPGPLDPSELTAMRAHAQVGAHLLNGANDPTLSMAAQIALHHHEWWNSAGYPMGLGRESIPLPARICAYADVYDALTNVRPYKGAWSHRMTVEHMMSEVGAHFDPDLMKPFLKVLERYVVQIVSSSASVLTDMKANRLIQSRNRLMHTLHANDQMPRS